MAVSRESEAASEIGWGVGTVAARLGIAASTLRTWERRYDVGPSRRTAGGHRRYTETDIDRVVLTQLLIARGAPARGIEGVGDARAAHALDAAGLADALDAEQGRAAREDLNSVDTSRAILQAATAGESRRIARLVGDALEALGAAGAWTDVIAPTLIEIGNEWAAGRLQIEAEHLTSEVIVGELRAYTRDIGNLDRNGPAIILASAEDDQHSLPIFAIEAALAEAGMGSLVLGAQLPAQSLASITRRERPRVVFVWASLARTDDEAVAEVLAEVADETTLILAGPGWPHGTALRLGAHGVLESSDLRSTVGRIGRLLDRDGVRSIDSLRP
jgi:DNA-binding transcriptional MerR regulator/methylmalonyl-CoA mutase cobalamin-binding subunit